MLYDGEKYKLQSFTDYFKENDYKEVIIHLLYNINNIYFIIKN